MPLTNIVKAKKDHVAQLIGRIRKADQIECLAASGKDVDEILPICFRDSKRCWVYIQEGVAEAIFGVSSCNEKGVGIPWLLGTDVFTKNKVCWRVSKEIIAKMFDDFYLLLNYVDKRNKESIKLLKWCGFTIEEPTEYGVAKKPFCLFHMRKDELCATP